jgi:hypothetical protein
MNLRDTIKKILKEEIKKDLSPIIENLLNDTIVKDNNDIICKVEVRHPSNRKVLQYQEFPFKFYRVDIFFKSEFTSPRINDKHEEIMNQAWDIIYEFIGIPSDIFSRKVKDCNENGVIQEDKRSDLIKKMTDDFGLYDTIKMVGNSNDVLNYINYEDISDENKIKFINEFTKKMAHNYGRERNFTVFDIGISPVMYDKVGNTERTINSFHVNGVNATVYKNDRYDTGYAMLYSHMPTEKLDKIFKLMLELSDNL